MLTTAPPPTPRALVSPSPLVEIFELDLAEPAPVDADWEILSATEQSRASRFRHAHDRARSIRCRAALRRLLGNHLGLPPDQVTILAGDHGKPYAAPVGSPHFNVSHTSRLALFALSAAFPVGIDVEEIDPDFPCLETALTYFAPDEVSELEALPAEERRTRFFASWTAKEALAKAHGSGLLILPLDSLRIDRHRARLEGINYRVIPIPTHAPHHLASLAFPADNQ